MSDRLLVSTRKGLIVLERKGGAWTISNTAFPGVPVTAALADPRDGAIFVALKHGHFGPKMHRSDDGGCEFVDIGTPAFPTDAAGAPAVLQYWTLESGGPHHPDRLWIGAIPAGLFRSDDRGHVCIFADGARLPREIALAYPIGPDSQLHVMQALSGG